MDSDARGLPRAAANRALTLSRTPGTGAAFLADPPEAGLGVLGGTHLADQVRVIPGPVAGRIGPLPADLEELARLVALHEQELLQQPPPPGPLIERGGRDDHVMVDPHDLLGMVGVRPVPLDDQRQAL